MTRQLTQTMFKTERLHLVPKAASKYLHAWLIAAVTFLGLISATAKADDIQFNDLRDKTTVTKNPPEGTTGETISVEGAFGFVGSPEMGAPICSGEVCSITIRGERNFQFTGASSRYPFTQVDDTHFYITITEEDGDISDVVLVDTSHASETDSGATLIFLSDTQGALSSLSRFQVPQGSPVENGKKQLLFSLNWHDPSSATTDTATIFVKSDKRLPCNAQ